MTFLPVVLLKIIIIIIILSLTLGMLIDSSPYSRNIMAKKKMKWKWAKMAKRYKLPVIK